MGVQGARDGAYRASFEDKPLLSDIVFLRWGGPHQAAIALAAQHALGHPSTLRTSL
jgi:hypothetical protein